MIGGGQDGAIAFLMGALVGYAVTLAFIAIQTGAATVALEFLPILIAILLPTIAVLIVFIKVMIEADRNNGDTRNTDCFFAGISSGIAGRTILASLDNIFLGVIGGLLGLGTGFWSSRGCLGVS